MESCNTSLDGGEMKNNCSQESADSLSDVESSVKNGVGKNLVPGEKTDLLRNKTKGEQQNVSLNKDKIDNEESKENQLSKIKSPVDKITVEDESDVIITSSEKLEKAEKKSDSSSKGESDPLKVVIKLTDGNDNKNSNDDEVEVLNTAVKINLANNGLESIAKENQRKVNDLNSSERSRLHLQSSNCQSNSLLTSNSNNQLRSGPFTANNNRNKVQQPPELQSFNLANQQNNYAPLSGAKTTPKPHISSMSPLNSSQSSMNSSKGGTSPFCSSPNFSNFSINDNDDSKDTLPNSSVEQIEAIKRETLLHSMSTKAQRILKAKAKAELLMKADEKLGPLANFLNNLGLDIVKQSVYQEAIHIQSRKQQSGKLTDVECSQLDKMRTSCRELAEKLKHLKLSYRKCKLCNFVSESVNVHFWHREHPHVNKREDFCCSYCDFLTRNNLAFNFHMEAEHNIKGRSMEKPAFWQCSLCPFEHNSKSKLTQHRWKCEKNFEMKTHLSPSPETDINYSLYGVFYLSEKEEALKAIALHKAKQNQIKAQQAQFKLQQQQAAANRASYFNANKISPIQSKPMNQGGMNINQRIPVLVHPKIGQPQVPGNQLRNFNARGNMPPNRFQQQSSIRPMVNHPGMKHFSPGMPQNNIRGTSLLNPKGHQNLSLMRTQLPVKDLLNIHQQIKGHNVVTAKSLANQKLIPSNNQPINDVSEFEICELCGGYVKDREALRIHFFYAHRVEMPALMFEKPCPPLFCDVCEKKFWTSQGLQKHRVSLKHYAKGSLSQVCILCGCLVSHLLNHMTDTHQLNLQDFLNQKRCIVCGKVCQSRSETEIHMAASHGILVKRSNSNSMDAKVKLDEKGGGNSMAMATKTGTATPGSSASQLVKGNYCVFCKVPFASNAELTQHCLLVHKACKKCGMVLPAEGSLGNHRCQISIPTVKACSVCKKQILIQEFIKHVEERHLKKCSIKLKRLNSEEINAEMKEKKLHLDISGGASPCSISGNIDSGQNSVSGDVGSSNSSARSHKRKPEESDRAAKRSKLSLDNDSNFETKSESISISDSDDDVEVINSGNSSADKTKLDFPKNGSVDKKKESSKTSSVSESAVPEKMDVDESRDSEEEGNWGQKGTAADKDKQVEQENTTANNNNNNGSTSAKLESSKESDESYGSKKTPVKSESDKNLTDSAE